MSKKDDTMRLDLPAIGYAVYRPRPLGSKGGPFAMRRDRPAKREAADITSERQPARFVLRERTMAQHDATEAAFAPFDLSREEHYRAFLAAHAMALPGLELAVTGRGWPQWTPRFPQLADDLAALGAFLPMPIIASDARGAAAWGVQYVIEGSRLGGQLLVRQVPDGLPTRYLSPPVDHGARWRAFCDALDGEAAQHGPDWLDEASDSAIETFQHFRRAAQALSEDLS
ncbi:biliverdin-producing heme oxygenase [Croceicoccus sp. YJ47]|uniref:biliverdin-producing heme oxygenase n=1 Tax=Croceicoccus sp. YJ47 TaxID=2798724 RepID=UPI001922F8B5|nr:biliverdin-producing heme oxygenase [Croceicoccus sp. YJ47]QQN73050.1 biliverdin-producing heme oxygenase [Croceicoccus sp. YJ47]